MYELWQQASIERQPIRESLHHFRFICSKSIGTGRYLLGFVATFARDPKSDDEVSCHTVTKEHELNSRTVKYSTGTRLWSNTVLLHPYAVDNPEKN